MRCLLPPAIRSRTQFLASPVSGRFADQSEESDVRKSPFEFQAETLSALANQLVRESGPRFVPFGNLPTPEYYSSELMLNP